MSAINTALSGATMALQRFDRAAVSTVQDASQGNDLVSDFVEQIDARTAFAASISVIKTADEMTGRLLDLKA
jgi:flagellar hook protein FlgE